MFNVYNTDSIDSVFYIDLEEDNKLAYLVCDHCCEKLITLTNLSTFPYPNGINPVVIFVVVLWMKNGGQNIMAIFRIITTTFSVKVVRHK